MAKKAPTKSVKTAKIVEQMTEQAAQKPLGQIVCWNAQSKKDSHKYKEVVQALNDSGLGSDVARELLPRFAFSRAIKKMSDDRMIDAVSETEDNMVFQFTKKFLKDQEWKFDKETLLKLDKTSGVVKCDDVDLQKLSQEHLENALTQRTTSDITKIVQRLFEKHADLFAVRDQGGAYFVPDEHREFTDRIETFLKKLGGSVRRFPIAHGANGEGRVAVRDSIAESLETAIQDHNDAIAKFTVSTRSDTMEHAAAKIVATRVRVEALAHYLDERRQELLAKLDASTVSLRERVDAIATGKANKPPKSEGENP